MSYAMVRYVRQFREIFTEEGRRQVKITHQVGNQAPLISFTQTSDNGTTSAMVLAPNSEDGRQKLPCSFNNEVLSTFGVFMSSFWLQQFLHNIRDIQFSSHSQSLEIDAKPASSFVLMNSEPSNSFLTPSKS